jgi:hypothetical protein
LKLNKKICFYAIRFPLFYFGIARSESQLKLFVFATTGFHFRSSTLVSAAEAFSFLLSVFICRPEIFLSRERSAPTHSPVAHRSPRQVFTLPLKIFAPA